MAGTASEIDHAGLEEEGFVGVGEPTEMLGGPDFRGIREVKSDMNVSASEDSPRKP